MIYITFINCRRKLSIAFLFITIFFVILRILAPSDGLNIRCIDQFKRKIFTDRINSFRTPIIPKRYCKDTVEIAIYGFIYIEKSGGYTLEIKAPGKSSGYFLNGRIEPGEGKRTIHSFIKNAGFKKISLYYFPKNTNDYDSFHIFVLSEDGTHKRLNDYLLFAAPISPRQLHYFRMLKITCIIFLIIAGLYLCSFIFHAKQSQKSIKGLFFTKSSPFLMISTMLRTFFSDVGEGLKIKKLQKVSFKPDTKFEREESFFIKKLPTHLFILLLFSLLTIIYMFPLISHLDDSMVRSWHTSKPPNKDEAHDIYVTHWTTHNFHRGLQNLFTPDFFYGQKTALAQSENYIGNLPISLPLSIFFHDPVALLNSTSIVVFIMSLWGSYLLCYWFSRNIFASILASTAVNFYSNRLVNWGWLNLHSIQWFPFAILVFILLLKRKKIGYGFLFVIFFFLQATTNGYYGPLLLCVIMIITLSYYIFNPKEWNWKHALTIVLIIIICIAAIYPIYSIYRKTAQDVKMYRPDYSIIQWSSTILGDLSSSSILLKNFIGKNSDCDSNNAAKGGQFPGFIFLTFFFYFFSLSIKDRNKQKGAHITAFQIIRLIILVVFILILLLAILAVTCAGITDSITLKEIIFLLLLIILADAVFRFLISERRKTLAAGLLIAGLCLFIASFGPEFSIFSKTFRTFYYYLHKNISLLYYYRGLSRLSLLFMQIFAPITACGIAVFLERISMKNRKIAIFTSIFLFAFILCETRVKMNILPVEEKCPKQYQMIKESKGKIVLLELPISRSNYEAVYHQLYHGKKLVNGISEKYFPEIMKLKFMMKDFPSKNSIQSAENYGITHILINNLNPAKKEKILRRLREWQSEIQILGVYEHEVLVELKSAKKE